MTVSQSPDSLRRVLDSVFAAPRYRWVPARDPFAVLRNGFERVLEWFAALARAHPVDYRLLVIALSVLLAAILVHIGWLLLRTMRAPTPAAAKPATLVVPHDREWFRREAGRLATHGRYDEAAQAEFVALVMALDARHLLTFHPSKTPGEYLREIRVPPAGRHRFSELVGDLYGYAFARRPIDARDFDDWRSRAQPERYEDAH